MASSFVDVQDDPTIDGRIEVASRRGLSRRKGAAVRTSPTNVQIYLELRPNAARIGRLMWAYIYVIASQGMLRIVMIVIMARFVGGL